MVDRPVLRVLTHSDHGGPSRVVYWEANAEQVILAVAVWRAIHVGLRARP